MSWIKRTEITLTIGSIAIAVMLLSYFVNIPVLDFISKILPEWSVIIASFALGVGAISTFVQNTDKIINKPAERPYSLILIISLVFMFIVANVKGFEPIYEWTVNNVYQALTGTVSSLLAFFILTAAIRALRGRNLNASAMLVSTVLVVLGNTPLMAGVWSGFETIKSWIMQVMNTASQRGIMISAAVGVLVMGFRVLIWLERGFYGRLGEE